MSRKIKKNYVNNLYDYIQLVVLHYNCVRNTYEEKNENLYETAVRIYSENNFKDDLYYFDEVIPNKLSNNNNESELKKILNELKDHLKNVQNFVFDNVEDGSVLKEFAKKFGGKFWKIAAFKEDLTDEYIDFLMDILRVYNSMIDEKQFKELTFKYVED